MYINFRKKCIKFFRLLNLFLIQLEDFKFILSQLKWIKNKSKIDKIIGVYLEVCLKSYFWIDLLIFHCSIVWNKFSCIRTSMKSLKHIALMCRMPKHNTSDIWFDYITEADSIWNWKRYHSYSVKMSGNVSQNCKCWIW